MADEVSLVTKYRPKKLSDVIGQQVVVKAFTNAFKANNMHHAYILAGAWGTGKTTVGRIVAAMENCEKGRTLEPCGECNNCKQIFSGKSFDVKEIDAASNRGVDDIRQLHRDLYTCPTQCRKKYVILDECHSLTGIAAEASLKMIEEPPSFVRFILATTEPHRLKNTIHSRCIMWKFNKVNWTEIYSHLVDIATKEGIEYEEEALKIAARAAKGSVRDSLQNLQTMMNYVGKGKITSADAVESLGMVEQKMYFELFDAICNKNTLKCYQSINNILKNGKEAGAVIKDIYSHLDNLLISLACKSDLSSFSFSEDEIKKYCHQSSMFKGTSIIKIMNLMNYVNHGLTVNLDPQILLNKFALESIVVVRQAENKNN
jgi:DNA polymerase III subunit gamma/tau